MKGFYTFMIWCMLFPCANAQNFYTASPEAKKWVEKTFNRLSKDEKIAQLMVVRLSSITPEGVVFYDQKVESEIKKYNIGSICLFQGSPVEQANLINRFQKIAKTPLMICIDGETGVGMRMYDSVMKFPDQLTIGAIQDPALVYEVGKAIGQQCKRAGIQVNYAPVVDINNNPLNPVIGIRSFGADKYKVADYGIQMMKGIQDAGVMACAKHFPGHGDVSVDSHLDLPVINKTMAELDSLELYPFRQLFKAGVGSVMIAHLSIPAIDTARFQPTSLSKKNITGLLRNEMGFEGISFTDALEMKGVTKYYPNGVAAAQSLIAGNDMLCLPGDIQESIEQIRKAIRHGKLSWAEIDKKVKKVLLAKYNLGLANVQPVNTDNLTRDLNENVKAMRAKIAEEALTVLQLKNSSLLPLSRGKKIAYVGIGLNGENHFSTLLENKYGATSYYFSYKDDVKKAEDILQKLGDKYDVVVIGLHQYNKYPAKNFGISDAAVELMHTLQKNNNSLSFIFGNPYAIKNIFDAPNLVACYEDDAIFQDAAFNLLEGNIFAKGKLPVTVCDVFPVNSGIVLKDPFPTVKPETVGMDGMKLNKIDSIAKDAIAKHATPGCVVMVAKDGKPVFYRSYGYLNYDSIEPVKKSTLYDLASVTKISATTISVMKLYEEGKLDINKTVGDYLPWVKGSDKAKLPLKDILLHQAGLVAYIPFYKETIDNAGLPKPGYYKTIPDSLYNVRVAANMYMRKNYTDTLYQRIVQSKLGPLNKYIYSDNDFIFLGKIVESITGKTLDTYAAETFYRPLQMVSTGFKPIDYASLDEIAPTEKEKYFRLQLLRGDVHDPGAAMFGGVAGHAGLFSNGYDLAQLYLMLSNGGAWNGVQFFKRETIDFFTANHSKISRRGLGFDKPEKDNATSKDPYPSRSASQQTYGHTGYTGTCVWVDPKYNLVYIFLSNRVCPDGGENLELSNLNVRSNIQEVIYGAMMNK